MDRQVSGVLKPTLQAEFNSSESYLADIIFWYQLAYAVGYVGFCRIVDVFGSSV